MTTSAESSKQIERMSGLDFYPHNDKAALRELRLAGESAHSGETLAQVVGEWLAEQTRCAKPAELRRAIHERQSAPPALPKKPECPACLNTGLVSRDGSERVLTGAWGTMAEIVKQFKGCPFCSDGEAWRNFGKKWRSNA